jgi:signal peptidase I
MYIKYDHYKKKLNFKKLFKDILLIYFLGVITVLVFNSLLIQAFCIKENSMIPQIEENTCVLVNKYIYGPKYPFVDSRIYDSTKNIKRGDIVVFYSEQYINKNKIVRFVYNIIYVFSFSLMDLNNLNDTRNVYIKRIIGIPGDVIKYQLVENKIVLFINGVPEKEVINMNYKIAEDIDRYPILSEYTVKNNEYYVLGDNRKYSFDSRFIGSISSKQIIGKAVIKYWNKPFNWIKLGALK